MVQRADAPTEGASMDELIDEGELSLRLGVAPATLKVWRVRGQGPKYVKVGERVRYSVGDVQAWVESRKVTPGKAEEVQS